MNTPIALAGNARNRLNNGNSSIYYAPPNPTNPSKPNTKFWGIWLPVPTFLAIVNSLFWTWLILSTVGYTEAPLEKASEQIIEKF